MKLKIGFTADSEPENDAVANAVTISQSETPMKSVVQVHFPDRHMTLAYFNDAFDLHRGDIVYVNGKLEGLQGYVVDVAYNFKIKVSDYKKVIAKADTNVKGKFHMFGSHFVTFDQTALPFQKVITWFNAPINSEDEFIISNDNTVFSLDNLSDMNVRQDVAVRGEDYYLENKVIYICINGTHGNAIVKGSKYYEVEFNYSNGEISNLVCNCFCSYTCKHEFAVILQLRETLKNIEKYYTPQYEQSNYFAVISKPILFSFAIDGKDSGSITLE